MEFWTWFWGLLLLATLLFYAGLVVYVAIGGFADIRQMFRTLAGEGRDLGDKDPPAHNEPPGGSQENTESHD